jgi:hypothetical protein
LSLQSTVTAPGCLVVFVALLVATTSATAWAETPRRIPPLPISLSETVSPSPLIDVRKGNVAIVGRVYGKRQARVAIRVTRSLGVVSETRVPVVGDFFRCRYPADFAAAPRLVPCVLFVDATADVDFNAARTGHFQAEATVILYDGGGTVPDLPSALTCGLLDRDGRTDRHCSGWPIIRTLVDCYMHSRAAQVVRVGRPDFDLARPADLAWFKNHLSFYEFDYRDRDWSQPLGHRPRRTFWQSVWNAWFNSSNDHPLDGNPLNRDPGNYLPYVFTNDFADILIAYLERRRSTAALEDNLVELCGEGAENLMAMQHRDPGNFALPDAQGKRETYTAGAFRYGMFKNGEFLTEGKGWFYNPSFRDYADGGVLNGRALWALGEALRCDPKGPLAARLKDAMALGLKFCLHDGTASRYSKRTDRGNPYWRDVGEHAYLLLGMLAACEAAPETPIRLEDGVPPMTLRDLCVRCLNALVDLERPEHQWSVYPNVDSMAVAALAEGARLLRAAPDAARWRQTAMNVADAWMAAQVDPQERAVPAVQFGLRVAPTRMTYVWKKGGKLQFFYYQDGHWIQALAELYALTAEARYRRRAEALASYLCGDNPWQLRLFNELGGVYNWTDDTDGDGIEDLLKQDMYPESTAYCQIGILRLLRALAGNRGSGR